MPARGVHVFPKEGVRAGDHRVGGPSSNKEIIVRRARSLRLIAGIAGVTAAALALSACGNSGSTASSSATSSAATSAGTSSASSSASTSAGSCDPIAPAAGSSTAATSSESSASETAGTGGTALKVGLAFDTGGRGDGTFNDSAANGADRAKAELGVTVDELEASTDDDRTPNLTLLSSQKDNPIIAVGFLWSDTLNTIAAANPDLTYGIVDSVVDQPNVKSLVFAEEQGSFLVGAAAALKTTTCKIGFIGGQEGALIKRFEAGYIAGAKAVRPDIQIDSKYLGPEGDNTAWSSPDKAKEIAKSWYAAGTDVVYSAAGGSGAGTIEAAVEATAAGSQKWAIGVDQDQYLTVTPDQQKVLLTSMVKRVDVAIYQTIKQVQDGDTKGGTTLFDLKVDGVGYATSGGYLDDIKGTLDDYKQQIIDGTIVVPQTP
jgi:basic membrane protein A